jgi:ankyrin repeat protein
LNSKDDVSGQTILHQAIENEHEDIVRLLVSHRSVKASVPDRQKRTSLHLAVRTGKLRLVELLLKICREVDLPGPNDQTPLHEATLGSSAPIVEQLVKRGANPLIQDKDHVTPIGIAAIRGSISMLEVFLYRK